MQNAELTFSRGRLETSVSVIVPLYNYPQFIEEALDSVAQQTFDDLALIVIDDCSTDNSHQVVEKWMRSAPASKHSLFLLANFDNVGLSITRNTGIHFSKSEYCFFLDADNVLCPACVERHVSALSTHAEAAGAFSVIEVFGSDIGLIGTNVFNQEKLKHGNYIDAMAMLRRNVLIELDGFYSLKHGWEDYDLWLRLVEEEEFMVQIPEILSKYRVHDNSMLRTQTNVLENLKELHREIFARHGWLELEPIGPTVAEGTIAPRKS